MRITQYDGSYEDFYVAGFKDGKVHLLTKYMVKPSTNMQSTDIVYGTDTVVFSSTNYWSSSASNYPYDLTTNTASITEADTPALYYAKQYGAKYGVNGTLLTKEEVDRIVGRTPDNKVVYSTDSVVTWPSWFNSQFYSGMSFGNFWLGSAQGSNYVWSVQRKQLRLLVTRLVHNKYRSSSSYRNSSDYLLPIWCTNINSNTK